MRDRYTNHTRILGIDPTRRGFAFAVLERRGQLVDWGRKKAGTQDRSQHGVREVVRLVREYQPRILALEDCGPKGSRRSSRVRAVISKLKRLATARSIRVRSIHRTELRIVLTGNARANKHDIAVAVCARFPELTRHLPPKRRPWMTEDDRINLFDAVAVAVMARESDDVPPS